MGCALGWNNYRRSCNQAIRNLGVRYQTIDRKLKCDRVFRFRRLEFCDRVISSNILCDITYNFLKNNYMEPNSTRENSRKENLASFLKNPTRDNLRSLLMLESVEDNDLDFKRELIPYYDIAKHILAMSNKNGGAIIFGVDEIKANNFSVCGLDDLPDRTDILKGINAFIPFELTNDVDVHLHRFNEQEDQNLQNKMLLSIIVEHNPKYIPFVSLKDKDNKLKKNTIYIRRNGASEIANYDEIQDILNRRIETEYSTTNERELIEHLEELKKLYSYIPKTVRVVNETISDIISSQKLSARSSPKVESNTQRILKELEYRILPNPDHPKESYEAFIGKLIEIKKEIIINLVKSS